MIIEIIIGIVGLLVLGGIGLIASKVFKIKEKELIVRVLFGWIHILIILLVVITSHSLGKIIMGWIK